jgi:hypothetical protein
MRIRPTNLLLASLIGVLGQGCVVFPYPTPEVKGAVVDAATKKPIAGARVEARKHKRISCVTASDGSFDLAANHIWGPCFLMPGDYFLRAPLSFKAPGYHTVTNDFYGGRDGRVVLTQPIELQRALPQ